MSDFNKDDYLKDLPDVDSLNGEGASGQTGGSHEQNASASAGDSPQVPAAPPISRTSRHRTPPRRAAQRHQTPSLPQMKTARSKPHNLRKITRSMLPPVLPTTARTVTPTTIRTAP